MLYFNFHSVPDFLGVLCLDDDDDCGDGDGGDGDGGDGDDDDLIFF